MTKVGKLIKSANGYAHICSMIVILLSFVGLPDGGLYMTAAKSKFVLFLLSQTIHGTAIVIFS